MGRRFWDTGAAPYALMDTACAQEQGIRQEKLSVGPKRTIC